MVDRDRAPLRMEGVHLSRAGREVLCGIDVAFERGVVTAIVGPSGAGKTSLLRCLNRLEDPDRGRVFLDGTDLREMAPTDLRRRVGMIFQTPVLFDGGVRANLAYGLNDATEEQMRNALEEAGL